MSTRKASSLLLGCSLMIRSVPGAYADEAPARDYDRFDLRVGGGWVFGANTTATLTGAHSIGTVIDYGSTLDGETSNSLLRIDGTWRMARRHALSYSWYDVNRTGLKNIDEDIQFGDQDFPIGTTIDSQLDIKLSRMMYTYGLARTDEVNLDIGGGFYWADISMTLTAESNVGQVLAGTSQSAHLKAPLPSADLSLEYKISKRWSATFVTDWFYFNYDNWSGSMTDTQIGLVYKLAKNWSLGAAYDHFNVDLKGPVGDGSFKIENGWNSLYSYLSFHW